MAKGSSAETVSGRRGACTGDFKSVTTFHAKRSNSTKYKGRVKVTTFGDTKVRTCSSSTWPGEVSLMLLPSLFSRKTTDGGIDWQRG